MASEQPYILKKRLDSKASGTASLDALETGGGASSVHSSTGGQVRSGVFGFMPWHWEAQQWNAILHHIVWKVATVFFSVVLLFGSQIQNLWIPAAGDTAFDILLLITFCFFVVDIIIRLVSQPSYFLFNICGWPPNGRGSGSDDKREIVVGTYIFWCDILSTAMLLYDISYVNPQHFDVVEVNIQLNEDGIPISGFNKSNRFQPVELERDLIVTIFRTLRVARFVRAHSAKNPITSRINWFWFFHNSHRFNPRWYWKQLQARRQAAAAANKRNSNPSSANNTNNSHTASGQDNRTSDASAPARRRTSWGALQLRVLAALKAQAELEAQGGGTAGTVSPLFENADLLGNNGPKRNKGVFGFLRGKLWKGHQHSHLDRQVAATKIQRAWRAHYQETMGDFASTDDFGGTAWVRGGSGNTGGRSGNTASKSNGSYSTAQPSASSPHASSTSGVGVNRESQVGSDMRELTGQRVAVGLVLALVCTVIFTYTQSDSTRATTMVVLHQQTKYESYQVAALNAARASSVPDLYSYQFENASSIDFTLTGRESDVSEFRDREKMRIVVSDSNQGQTVGWFAFRVERIQTAWVEVVSTFFIIFAWFFGVAAFSGPIMSLVVIPIERMVRLLGMLMLDPLGYQSTSRYNKFMAENDTLFKNTRWTNEVLKGMETSFLMSTITRIGSLMKVGFGSAGVEIIRNNLQKGQNSKNVLNLKEQGRTVSCIFLFCDVRQFTDATECLQEEVFVFTNKIARVVHSICNAYNGSANKNVGDAFLVSWLLDDDKGRGRGGRSGGSSLQARNNQADKALLSVIKICIALHYDKYYIETMSEAARTRLINKLAKRPGPVVQMGFGLHAGRAVQGAIGSQRKIDATYVSEAVERSEFLESSTKKYGLKMLLSDSFHQLLHPNTRRRCRKVDQILLVDDDEDDDDQDEPQGEHMELFTFDMDVEVLFKPTGSRHRVGDSVDGISDAGDNFESIGGSRNKRGDRRSQGSTRLNRRRRASTIRLSSGGSDEMAPQQDSDGHTVERSHPGVASNSSTFSEVNDPNLAMSKLILPTGPALYNQNVWQTPEMKRIRERYIQGLFYPKFNQGLQAFYKKDWDSAAQCFQTILDNNFDDGPTHYFMAIMKRHGGVPPRDFLPYGIA